MQRTLILAFLASSCIFAQPETNRVFVASGGFGGGPFQRMSTPSVQGAPYSATITNESVQTLADGNRIVQTSTGNTARDSMGRTRQDAPLLTIGNMSPADAPHLVFLQDPVAQTSYTLNLTEKTAMKGGAFSPMALSSRTPGVATSGAMVTKDVIAGSFVAGAAAPLAISIQKTGAIDEGQAQNEDLGSKTMEGVSVMGTRTTRTVPAGQIGNDKPLSIVTEVWMSPELKTIVYSKRSDPRTGDQTFALTNIVRSEPDPSLFMVPSDFKLIDTPGPIMYKTAGVPAQ
ncbi:MAG TPA: hypothetical protein VK686_23615 [Bryobacteraceae bacterium]|nr:hypothetical protein [Bryobacteraceae bacterium]